MSDLLECLQQGRRLLADGAMGTMLFERGLRLGDCPERFNLEREQVLEEIAASYLEAGSDIISTNTFGGAPLKLAQYKLDHETQEVNRRGVAAVKRVVADQAVVAASCGPCGKLLTPYGEVEPEEVEEGFARQIGAQVEGGADLILVETMTDLREAELAVKAAKRVAPQLPVAATMTFDSTPRGFFTIMGVSIPQAVAGLEHCGVDLLGSNCGNGIEQMVEIATQLRQHASVPVIIQANAGLPVNRGGTVIYPETPAQLAAGTGQLLELGVAVIGGCCGTTPAHIRAMREVINRWS